MRKHHQIQPEQWSMSGLARDGTTETVSRGQILRHEQEQGNIQFVKLTTSRISNHVRNCPVR